MAKRKLAIHLHRQRFQSLVAAGQRRADQIRQSGGVRKLMTNDSNAKPASSDLTFITNEAGQSLRDRFAILLGKDTRLFDCLVGYFFISGFHRLYPALENVEKIRILVGLQTDRTAYDLLQRAKEQGELSLWSHASS